MNILSRFLIPFLPARFYVSRWPQRYAAWLEDTLFRRTKFVESETNGEALWERVRRAVSDFLLTEFQRGAFVGTKPEQGFFVRCDRTTMTQDDIDNGRLICLVGVATLRPAEFVIFRIGQWTRNKKLDQ